MYSRSGHQPVGCVLITVNNQPHDEAQQILHNSYSLTTFYQTNIYQKYEKIFNTKKINIIAFENLQNPPPENTILSQIYFCKQPPNNNKYVIQFPIFITFKNIIKLRKTNCCDLNIWIQYYHTKQDNKYIVCDGISFTNWYDIINLNPHNIIIRNICQYSHHLIASKIYNIVFGCKLDLTQYPFILTQKCMYYDLKQDNNDHNSEPLFIISIKFNADHDINLSRQNRTVCTFINEINRLLRDNINEKHTAVYKAYQMNESYIKSIGYNTLFKENEWFHTNGNDTNINGQNTNNYYADYSDDIMSVEPGAVHVPQKQGNLVRKSVYDDVEYSSESESDSEQKGFNTNQFEISTKNQMKCKKIGTTEGKNNNNKFYSVSFQTGKTNKFIDYKYNRYVFTFVVSPTNPCMYALITKFYNGQYEILDCDDVKKWKYPQKLKLLTSTTNFADKCTLHKSTKKQMQELVVYYQKKCNQY